MSVFDTTTVTAYGMVGLGLCLRGAKNKTDKDCNGIKVFQNLNVRTVRTGFDL